MMMRSALYLINTLSWICIVLVHWNNYVDSYLGFVPWHIVRSNQIAGVFSFSISRWACSVSSLSVTTSADCVFDWTWRYVMGRIQGMNLHKMIWMEADLSWIFGECYAQFNSGDTSMLCFINSKLVSDCCFNLEERWTNIAIDVDILQFKIGLKWRTSRICKLETVTPVKTPQLPVRWGTAIKGLFFNSWYFTRIFTL
jgi:hypothetical protein